MKKGIIILLIVIVIVAVVAGRNKSSDKSTNESVSNVKSNTSLSTKEVVEAPAVTSVPLAEDTVSEVDYRSKYNEIAKYTMSGLESNVRNFRKTAVAGGCSIEFNDYADTVGYYEIIIYAKTTNKEDEPVFTQVCQDMITSIDSSIEKEKLDKIIGSIKKQTGLEDYYINENVSVTYHRPISWSAGHIVIKVQ